MISTRVASRLTDRSECPLQPVVVLRGDCEITCASWVTSTTAAANNRAQSREHQRSASSAAATAATILCAGDSRGVATLWDLSIRRPLAQFSVPYETVPGDPAGLRIPPLTEDSEHARGLLRCQAYLVSAPDKAGSKQSRDKDIASFIVLTQGRNQLVRVWDVAQHRCPGRRRCTSATLGDLKGRDNGNNSDDTDDDESDDSSDDVCSDDGRYTDVSLRHSMWVPQFGFCPFAALPVTHVSSAAAPPGASPELASPVSSPFHLIVSIPGDNDGMAMCYTLACPSAGLGKTAQGNAETLSQQQQPLRWGRVRSRAVNPGCGLTCGQMMHQRLLRVHDAVHLAACFESGHFALCDVDRGVRCIAFRAFPDPATACALHVVGAASSSSDNDSAQALDLYLASAEGFVHGYRLEASAATAAAVQGPKEDGQHHGEVGAAIPTSETPALEFLVAAPRWELKFPKGVGALALSPAGRLLALGGWDSTIRLYDTQHATIVSVLSHHSASVADLCFADPGKRATSSAAIQSFVSTSNDSTIAVWELPALMAFASC